MAFSYHHGPWPGIGSRMDKHGPKVAGADQIWFAILWPGIAVKGEIINSQQIYQKQLAQTIAMLLGIKFTADHPVADAI